MTNWTTLKIRPAPANTRVVTGIDPIQTDLAPGLEMRPPNSIFDRSFSFHIDLAEYIFPAELTGSVEIQILSLEYEFPVIAMSMKTIRESSKATDGDNRM